MTVCAELYFKNSSDYVHFKKNKEEKISLFVGHLIRELGFESGEFSMEEIMHKSLCAYSRKEGDIRHSLFNLLAEKPVISQKLQGSVVPVSSNNDLTYLEVVQKIDFYLRLEGYLKQHFFNVFSDGREKVIWEKVDALAFSRIFFQLSSKNEQLVLNSQEDMRINEYVKLLSIYPSIVPKFDHFYKNILGLEAVKVSLFFELIFPILMPEEALKEGKKLPSGALLYGPPGCGKKFVVERIAKAIGYPMIVYEAGMVVRVEDVFRGVRALNKGILFIQEASSVFPSREYQGGGVEERKEVSLFFQSTCRLIEECRQNGTVLICSTSYPENVDSSVLGSGRVDRRFYIAPPDEKSRKVVFLKALKTSDSERMTRRSADCDRLATLTSNWNFLDIQAVLDKGALRKRTCSDGMYKVDSIACMETEIAGRRPSLTLGELEKFTHLEEKLKRDSLTASDREIEEISESSDSGDEEDSPSLWKQCKDLIFSFLGNAEL